MRLTLTLQARTTLKETWLIEYNGQLIEVHTKRHSRRKGIERHRRVITKALNLNPNEYRFIGNRYQGGRWFTEWMVL